MSTSAAKYRHGELRAVLIQAALGLLAEDGADALSLRAVARRAGVSAMTPYRHYPDKEALLAAVAVEGFNGLRDVLREADGAGSPSPLVAQAAAYVRFATANPALFRLMFGPVRSGDHPGLQAAGDDAYAVLAERVAVATPASTDRDALALGCWSFVHGLASLFLDGQVAGKFTAPADEVTRHVAGIMLAHFPAAPPASIAT